MIFMSFIFLQALIATIIPYGSKTPAIGMKSCDKFVIIVHMVIINYADQVWIFVSKFLKDT